MPLPPGFLNKSVDQIRRDLAGMPSPVLTSTLRLRETGDLAHLMAMLPGLIVYHLPPGKLPPPEPLPSDLRLREDIGLDSLALSELAFKLDEVFAVPIETHEVAHVITVQDLQQFLRGKLGAPSATDVLTAALPVIS